MKNLSFESTLAQRDELLEISKSGSYQHFNVKELNNFLFVLRFHYQESKSGTFVHESLKVAVENTESFLQLTRAEKSWYEKPMGLIGIGVFVGIVTTLLVNFIYSLLL
ncbi:hypothetical protein B6N13_18615 [Marinomonas sp. UCMA 3892]|uniref:hypothetical protein n=1 Tax=unclassified Marinomonas TaxID=196814 RepID=UPI00146F43F2|nr:hypothetical protein [Marinomonas sp. UCMA 3892]NLV00086.1 hypothetical protein [Marinomonas sp. UCMA 3892]